MMMMMLLYAIYQIVFSLFLVTLNDP